MNDFIGAGWSFPIRLDTRGRVALAYQERDIEEAICLILKTRPGQRVMRPEFGCRIHELAFETNDGVTVGLARSYVEEALAMWEPRIIVNKVDVNPVTGNDPGSDPFAGEAGVGMLHITIDYSIKTTLNRRSLVFPFYRIPGE